MKAKSLLASFLVLALAILMPIAAEAKSGSTHVKGYTRKNGTYVVPHERSAPNKTKADNWSTKGNVNPYTGKKGMKTLAEPSSVPTAQQSDTTDLSPTDDAKKTQTKDGTEAKPAKR